MSNILEYDVLRDISKMETLQKRGCEQAGRSIQPTGKTVMVHCWPCQELRTLLVILADWHRDKGFARPKAACQELGLRGLFSIKISHLDQQLKLGSPLHKVYNNPKSPSKINLPSALAQQASSSGGSFKMTRPCRVEYC